VDRIIRVRYPPTIGDFPSRLRISGGTSGTVLYAYDEAGHLLGEYDATGALIEETVWLGDIPVATLRPNGAAVSIFYVHSDPLNTPAKSPARATMWRCGLGTRTPSARTPPTPIPRAQARSPTTFVCPANCSMGRQDSPVLLTDPTGEDAIALPLPAASTWVGPAAAVVGAGYAGWQIGSAIYPHIAVPLGDAIESVCRATSKARECEREWEDAYRQCQKMLSGRNPPQGVTGGYTSLYDCARGQVSERCGGNPIGPGGTSDWKFKPPGSTRKGRKK
jgi:hypothetical protein